MTKRLVEVMVMRQAGTAVLCVALAGLVGRAGGAEYVGFQGDIPQESQSILPTLLKQGPFELRPYFLGQALYDDNIRISASTNRASDLVWTLSPGILIGAGQYREAQGTFLALDYRPDILLYTDNDQYNTVDHTFNFNAQKRWEKLTLGVGQAFMMGSGGYAEAQNRVQRNAFNTILRGTYHYSDKTAFELTGRQTINDYDELISNNEWDIQAWVNYQVTPKTILGLGGTLGFRDVESAPNQTYEQVQVRGSYSVTEKTRMTGSLGIQFEQYEGGGNRGPIFVFGLGGSYQPRAGTSLSLDAYRNNRASVVAFSQNVLTTGIRASVRQLLRDRIAVTLAGGYENAEYQGVGVASSRRDNYFFVGPALDYNLTERWFIGVFYQYRRNTSNDGGYSFANNQAGVRTSYRF